MRRGFTLLEALVAVAIFSILLIGIFKVLDSGHKAFDAGNIQVEVEQEARRALDYISKELRQAGSSKISGLAVDDSSASITFEIPYDVDGDGDVKDASGDIEWSNDAGDNKIGTITYSLSNSQILRNLSLGGQSVLANRISGLTFSRPSTNLIVIDVTAEKYLVRGFTSSGDEKVSITLNTQVRLRN